MDLGNAIRTIRMKKGLRQSDVNIGKTVQTLSRIESGKIILNQNTLNEIIDTLDIEPVEFYNFAAKLDYPNNFVLQFRKASANPTDKILKKFILENYLKSDYQYSDISKHLMYYYSIKSHFKDEWDLEELNTDEVRHLTNHFYSRKYYGYFDYCLLCNVIIYFSDNESKKVFDLMYPIEQEIMRDSETKKYAFSAVLNVISKQIYEKQYQEALYYLEQAKKIDKEKSDYYFRLSIRYLENLCLFLTTHDSEHYGKLLNYISVLRDLGDDTTADLLKEEIKELAFGDPKNIKDSLIKNR